jgi:hypothetical protein
MAAEERFNAHGQQGISVIDLDKDPGIVLHG